LQVNIPRHRVCFTRLDVLLFWGLSLGRIDVE
jgi:hypothetical protein